MPRFVTTALFSLFISMAAWPVTAQDMQDMMTTPAPVAEAPQVAEDKPLMVIRFNQPRVYFGKQLSQAIGKAEKVKPDITYVVTSYVPSHFNPKQARANLQTVVGGMQTYGASLERIRWRSEASSTSTQEIYIHVD